MLRWIHDDLLSGGTKKRHLENETDDSCFHTRIASLYNNNLLIQMIMVSHWVDRGCRTRRDNGLGARAVVEPGRLA